MFKPQGTPRRNKTTANMIRRAIKRKLGHEIIQAVANGLMTKRQIYGKHPTK